MGANRETPPVHLRGTNGDGYREVLGIRTAGTESGAGWLGYFRDLTARGLSSAGQVAMVTSAAHAGLVEAIGASPPAGRGSGAAPTTPRTSWSSPAKS